MKRVLSVMVVFMAIFSFSLMGSVTHIWPSSGVNDTIVAVHIFGDGFNSGVSNVNLYKSGNPLITGSNISVVNDNYLTCEFDLTGVSTTTYNVIANTDTLDMCFTVNDYMYHLNNWDRTDLGSGGNEMRGVSVGDGNNDGELEVYGACQDYHIYQFSWNGVGWNRTDLGSGGNYMFGVAVGDGNNDGELEVYGACYDYHIYQFKWNGSSWDSTDLGFGGRWMRGVAVGDGNNDGLLEVYGACQDSSIYQFSWNGSSWDKTDLGSGGNTMRGVAVGDGNNDGVLEVYGACSDYHIYQFKWNGSSWDSTDLGSGWYSMYGVAVGDGNNDGVLEVYGANDDWYIYQFSWDGISWDKTYLGYGDNSMFGVAVGDGNNDGEIEVYGSAAYHLYQFKWNGASWEKTDLGSGGDFMSGVAVGDGNNDGEVEVYGSCNNNYIYQFKVIPEPKLELQDTTYDFSYTAFNDTSFWQYLELHNIGDTFLIIDSIKSSNTDFSIYNFNLPDTINISDSSLVEVIFSPIEEGLIAGTLAVYSNDPFETLQYVHLQGIGDSTAPTTVNLISPADSSYLNNNNVDFIWTASTDTLAGIDYYKVQLSFDFNFLTGLIDTNIIDTTGSINLVDSIYYWRVRAIDRAGNESSWSLYRSFEVDTENPDIPYLINPVGGNFYSNDTVDFSWTVVSFKDSESPIRYVIELDTLNTFTTPISTDTIDNNTIEKILVEDFYYWRVKAFDLAGNESPFSSNESFGIDITAPFIDSTTVWNDTTFTGPFTVNVKITDNTDIDTCFLYYKRGEDPGFQISEFTTTGGNWYTAEIPQAYLNPDTIKYYIYAKDISNPANEATDPSGAPANYYSFVVSQSGVYETTEIPAIFTFSYSYLSSEQVIFNLAVPEISDISLKIFDITGREVSSLISGQLSPAFYQIPFRPLSNGIYFYKLESHYQTKTGKFIIVK